MKVIKGRQEIDSNEARDDFLNIKHTANQHKHINIPIEKFRGGKGVATSLGCLIALNFTIGILICSCWLVVCLISKKSSLASLLSISCLPFITFIYYGIYELFFSLLLMAIIYLRHKDNLIRILKSEEPNVFGK